jgi:hypothetical protein
MNRRSLLQALGWVAGALGLGKALPPPGGEREDVAAPDGTTPRVVTVHRGLLFLGEGPPEGGIGVLLSDVTLTYTPCAVGPTPGVMRVGAFVAPTPIVAAMLRQSVVRFASSETGERWTIKGRWQEAGYSVEAEGMTVQDGGVFEGELHNFYAGREAAPDA